MRAPLAPELMRYPEGPPMGYGYRGNIGVPGASTFHEGIDIGIPTGTPVYAVADGVVVVATDSGAPGISILYQIDSTTRIRCNHFSRRYFSRGQSFREGRVIGLSGNTGASGGPHLHFSVFKYRNGRWQSIDPTPWLREMLGSAAGTGSTPFTPEQEEEDDDMGFYYYTDINKPYYWFNQARAKSRKCTGKEIELVRSAERTGIPGNTVHKVGPGWYEQTLALGTYGD